MTAMTGAVGAARSTGDVYMTILRGRSLSAVPRHELPLSEIIKFGLPARGQSSEVNSWRWRNIPNLMRGLRIVQWARALKIPHFYGAVSMVRVRPENGPARMAEYLDARPNMPFLNWLNLMNVRVEATDYGLASLRVVTTAGVGFIVDAFQNIVELEIMKYHGIGTGNTAEASGDTALVTELTTQYNPDSTRATGSLTEGGSGNVYRTVGTNTVDASAAVVEHGILSQAATGGGVLLDRSVFSVINLVSGDSLQSTYDLTVSAGG